MNCEPGCLVCEAVELKELRAWKEGSNGIEEYYAVVEELRQANLRIHFLETEALIGDKK